MSGAAARKRTLLGALLGTLLGTLLGALAACSATESGHGLGRPIAVLELPKGLRELSGVAAVGAQFWCVQDERGAIYRVDRDGNTVADTKFGAKGDYEDLAVVDELAFVLRSDGHLVAVEHGKATGEFALGSRGYEYESLAYDAPHQRLLYAPKASGKRLAALGDDRPVYAFDLATRTAQLEPVLRLSLAATVRVAVAAGLGGAIELRTSALATDPDGEHVWVLSGPDRLLVAARRDGTVRAVFRLDGNLLPQPEALCFDAGGLLWIGTEGAGERAKLVAFPRPTLTN
jgi:uncharacterized protein YjiK